MYAFLYTDLYIVYSPQLKDLEVGMKAIYILTAYIANQISTKMHQLTYTCTTSFFYICRA